MPLAKKELRMTKRTFMRRKKNKIIILIIFSSIMLNLLLLTRFVGMSPETVVPLGSFRISITSIQGILQSINFLICMLLVLVDYNHGKIIALTLIGLSVLSTASSIFITKDLGGLPGIANSIICIIAVNIVARFYQKSSEKSLTDSLTGLGNRRAFSRKLNEFCALDDEPFYVAYFEIKNFRQINDNFGLQAGDKVLKILSKNFKSMISKDDFVFRLMGSSFAVIFGTPENPTKKIDEIIRHFENTEIQINEENSCRANLLAGISKFPDDSKSPVELLKNADTALFHARKSPDLRMSFYSKKMEDALNLQTEAEMLIKEALEHDYFYLVYQPQYEISNKRLRGFETLIRMRRPDGSIVSPGIFIPAAEKSNLILKIDNYVLKRAMKEFKKVLEETKKEYIISINVSAKNISSPDFAEKVAKMLQETGFPSKCLEIEITEYSLAESIETTVANINTLKNLGVQIALDDFGTGYTSIAQLVNIPFNLLKIDKSLIDNIETSAVNRDIVDTVIYMGHLMQAEVISEGVETVQQLELLNNHKCDFVQGFVWGKPLDYADAAKLCV